MDKRGRKQSTGRFGPVYHTILTKEYLIENYVNSGRTPYMIAAEVGCSPRIVYNYIDSHGIERINYNSKKQIKINDKFGLLTTIKIVSQNNSGTNMWSCICDCGNTCIVPTSRLKSGRSKSCGCWRSRKKNHFWKGYCDMSGARLSEIRLRAKKKNMEFDLDVKFLWELYVKQNKKCAISNLDIIMNDNASLDRIDSTKGYTKDNVWWTHAHINKMKMDFQLDKFIEYCEIITNFNKKEV